MHENFVGGGGGVCVFWILLELDWKLPVGSFSGTTTTKRGTPLHTSMILSSLGPKTWGKIAYKAVLTKLYLIFLDRYDMSWSLLVN